MSIASNIISEHLDELRQLCRLHHVARLEVFGSAVRGQFDFGRSDLDFLVDFTALSPADHADAYFGLLAGMQDLFRRNIDLVEVGAIDNPYFKQSIEPIRTVLYAA